MKTKLLIALALVLLLGPARRGFAVNTEIADQLQALATQVHAKLKLHEGKVTETDLADELKGFDQLIARHKGEMTDDVAQILLLKATLYLQVLDNLEKGRELIMELKRDYPRTKPGREAEKLLVSIGKQQEAKRIRSSLVTGARFPDFDVKDLMNKPLSIADYKGKVVLIDFWAISSDPWVAELPTLMQTYQSHHGKGFEIIGISLDQDQMRLSAFIREKRVPWRQYFDGRGWGNKLAVKYGVNSLPSTYLLDRDGTILGKDLHGEDLEKTVAKALAAK